LDIVEIKSPKGIQQVATLAHTIWWQHFPPIIGNAQVEYMVNKFQSIDALTQQIAEGWEYYIIRNKHQDLGYAGLVLDHKTGRVQLSKLYVKQAARGKGAGVRLLKFIEHRYSSQGFQTLWLTVNRFNTDPIKWYKRRGFIIIDEIKMDIGSGFIMDDYILEKTMENQ
jgi:GNAT superfamily N-acetyltransferase